LIIHWSFPIAISIAGADESDARFAVVEASSDL
jgi:hypothetical protein